MGEVYTYSGTHLTTIRDGTVEFTQSAELGQVGSGRVAIDDTAGTLSIVGQKDFSATQSSCSIPLLFRGYISDRTYGRDAGTERAPHVGAGRGIEVQLQDTNACMGFRLIDGSDGQRPSETVNARKTWLMASDYVSGLFIDNGRISASTEVMDKADYRNQYPSDVLADMVQAALGFNYHVSDYGSGPELIFRNDNTQTADSSTLRISNVLADASGVTLHPFKDATLSRRPGDVYSKLALSYAMGTIYEERAATATAFNGERGGIASNSNIKTAVKARAQAVAMLGQHRTEEDVLECTVLATDAQVNLMPQGWRIQGKFSHLNTEGYGSFSWFQILEVGKKPIVADGGLYEVRLKLSPQEAEDTPAVCSDDDTPFATYYPLGGPGPGGGGNANLSDGVVYYLRSGIYYPVAPTVGHAGAWVFPAYSAGGAGNIDYAGDCVNNRIRFIVVGNGTMTIQTEIYGGSPKGLRVAKGTPTTIATVNETHVAYISSGASIEVEIDDATEGDCIRIIDVVDNAYPNCGGKWGWSAAEWAA